ncbi:hypothetical protein C2W62_08430 [Candidatus Entotheonella serta]|nr:hypothetical protein C2W62_08430 [Candidatus Entotheonella serta]
MVTAALGHMCRQSEVPSSRLRACQRFSATAMASRSTPVSCTRTPSPASMVLAPWQLPSTTANAREKGNLSTSRCKKPILLSWIEYALTGHVRKAMGNRHATLAPHGIYPCQGEDQGEDQWVAIAVEDDRQWQALCGLANEVAPLRDERFDTQAGRKQHETTLDPLISTWTRTQDKHEISIRLCAVGIPAAPVLNAFEVAADAALTERGHLVRVDHPETGSWVQSGVPARFSRTRPGVWHPAPRLGQHSGEVLSRLLGMTPDAYEALYKAGITGTEPPSAILST